MGGGGPGPPSLSTPSMAATPSDRLILSHALGTAEGGVPLSRTRLPQTVHRLAWAGRIEAITPSEVKALSRLSWPLEFNSVNELEQHSRRAVGDLGLPLVGTAGTAQK